MRTRRAVAVLIGAWVVVITAAHMALNVDWKAAFNDRLPPEKRKLNVAFIPVTCHLACPVTDFISRFSLDGNVFIPRMFQGFPEIKEALISNQMQAAFMVAPMAIALRAQGVPIKIVYLGHRYGSAVVVAKNGPIRRFGRADTPCTASRVGSACRKRTKKMHRRSSTSARPRCR